MSNQVNMLVKEKRKMNRYIIFFIKYIMGVIGETIGTYGGGSLGEMIGKKIGKSDAAASAGKKIGSVIGGVAGGALIPFRSGGRVKKTGPAYLHKGELIVPAKMVKDVSKSLKAKIKKNGGRNM